MRTSKLPALIATLTVVGSLLVALPGVAVAGEIAVDGDGKVYGGIYPGPVFFDAPLIEDINDWGGKNITFAGRFMEPNVTDPEKHIPGKFNSAIFRLNEAWKAEATPFVSFQIMDSASAIASGSWDARITEWAGYVKRWLDGENLEGTSVPTAGRSLIIAPFIEMNGNWPPFGCSPTNIKNGYRRMVDIFRGLGMDETQVRWSFAPNGWTPPGCGKLADYYPGDNYVDIIGFSAYNFGVAMAGSWDSPATVFGPWLDEIKDTISDTKPIMVAQTGSTSSGGDKNAWLDGMFSYLAADPQVVGLVYFNYNVDGDHACCPDDYPGWAQGMQRNSTKYQFPLTDWFRAGDLVVAGAVPPPPPPPPPPPGEDDPCQAADECDSVGLVTTSSARFRLFGDVTAAGPATEFSYGSSGHFPLMGDWDCDGDVTPGMYRPSDGYVYLRNSNSAGGSHVEFTIRDGGDVPLAGDWNGDGCDTVSVYNARSGKMYVKNGLDSGEIEYSYYFGNPGDKPFAGDFNGDGISTLALHRESAGSLYFRNTNTQGIADFDFYYGNPGDQMFSGDWNGDGTDTLAIYRSADRKVYYRMTNTQGIADHVQPVPDFGAVQVVVAPRTG